MTLVILHNSILQGCGHALRPLIIAKGHRQLLIKNARHSLFIIIHFWISCKLLFQEICSPFFSFFRTLNINLTHEHPPYRLNGKYFFQVGECLINVNVLPPPKKVICVLPLGWLFMDEKNQPPKNAGTIEVKPFHILPIILLVAGK